MRNDSMAKRHDVSKLIVKVVSVIVLMLFVLWARAFYGSMKDYEVGDTLLKENQVIRAIAYFDRSLH
jgi:hypothetical protein